jgi:hypothetical protein
MSKISTKASLQNFKRYDFEILSPSITIFYQSLPLNMMEIYPSSTKNFLMLQSTEQRQSSDSAELKTAMAVNELGVVAQAVIPEFGRLGQEDPKFKASLSYTARLYFKILK